MTKTNSVGYLKGYGMVWFDPNGIANILSLHRVIDKYHVQFDSRNGNKFIVWRDDGSCREFLPGPRGLYYCDMSKTHGTILTNDGEIDDAFGGIDPAHIITVKEIMKGFTLRELKHATAARKFQNTAGLTTSGIISVIDKKMLNNCPITRESIKHAVSIWGPSVANLDGKTIRRRTDAVILNENTITPLPQQILIIIPR